VSAPDGARTCSKCGRTLRSDNEDPDRRCGYCQAGVDPARHRAQTAELRHALDDLADGPLLEVSARGGGYGHRKIAVLTFRQVARAARRERARPGMRSAIARAQLARPTCRSQCADAPRPCPFVGCRFHLYLGVTPAGGLQVNHPGLELEDLAETCALDVADRGGVTLEEVGELLGVTRERVRQLETRGLERLKVLADGWDS
jgi:hypothetical protein